MAANSSEMIQKRRTILVSKMPFFWYPDIGTLYRELEETV